MPSDRPRTGSGSLPVTVLARLADRFPIDSVLVTRTTNMFTACKNHVGKRRHKQYDRAQSRLDLPYEPTNEFRCISRIPGLYVGLAQVAAVVSGLGSATSSISPLALVQSDTPARCVPAYAGAPRGFARTIRCLSAFAPPRCDNPVHERLHCKVRRSFSIASRSTFRRWRREIPNARDIWADVNSREPTEGLATSFVEGGRSRRSFVRIVEAEATADQPCFHGRQLLALMQFLKPFGFLKIVLGIVVTG